MDKRGFTRGFTLLEVLAVLFIVSVLLTLTVPRLMTTIRNARLRADLANLSVLNRVTERYKIESEIFNDSFELFKSSATDSEKMLELVEKNYLDNLIEANIKEYDFIFRDDISRWHYTLYPIDDFYVFGENAIRLDSEVLLKGVGTLHGTTKEDHIELTNGIFFLPNPKVNYTVNVVAQLAKVLNPEETAYLGNGYGIYFETFIKEGTADHEKGYYLQFTRAWRTLGLLKRNHPNEETLLKSPTVGEEYYLEDNFPGDLQDEFPLNSDHWWFEKHEIKIISKSFLAGENNRLLNVYLDGAHIIKDFPYKSDVSNLEDNLIGIRILPSNSRVKIYSIKIS